MRAWPRASWMWPCSASAGFVSSIAVRTAFEPTGSGAWPPCFGVMSSFRPGASSSPDAYGGQCRFKITRSGGFVSRCGHAADPLEQDVLGLLAVGVPRGHVRPACRRHLVVADLDDPPLGELDPASRPRGSRRPRTGRRSRGTRRRAAAARRASPQPSPSSARPSRASPCGRGRRAARVGLELGELVGRRAKRVVAAPDHVLLERGDRVLAGELAALLLERPMPALAAVVDDRDERLPGHVAAEDHHVGLVVRAGVQELAPARLGPVDVRREEDPHDAGDCPSRTGRNQGAGSRAPPSSVERDGRAVDDHRATVDRDGRAVHVARHPARPGMPPRLRFRPAPPGGAAASRSS